MKKILITGAGSYIGTSFENYINTNFPDKYTVDTVDMIGNGWKEKDFSPYDAVFHVAGIAHSDNGKIITRKGKALLCGKYRAYISRGGKGKKRRRSSVYIYEQRHCIR